MKIGNNLRKLRKMAGLTQKDIADMLNIHTSTVTKYERDDREPDLDTLCRLADVLEITVDELLGRK